MQNIIMHGYIDTVTKETMLSQAHISYGFLGNDKHNIYGYALCRYCAYVAVCVAGGGGRRTDYVLL